jgi:hypothetical protein
VFFTAKNDLYLAIRTAFGSGRNWTDGNDTSIQLNLSHLHFGEDGETGAVYLWEQQFLYDSDQFVPVPKDPKDYILKYDGNRIERGNIYPSSDGSDLFNNVRLIEEILGKMVQ